MTACSHSLQKEDLTCPSSSLLHDGELHQNTPLTHLFPENHWSTGWVGRGGRLLERCKNRGGAAAEWTWGTSNSRGGGQFREREQEANRERYAIAMQAAVHYVWPWGLQKREREGEKHRDRVREWDRAHHNRQRTGNSTIINPHSESLSLGS